MEHENDGRIQAVVGGLAVGRLAQVWRPIIWYHQFDPVDTWQNDLLIAE